MNRAPPNYHPITLLIYKKVTLDSEPMERAHRNHISAFTHFITIGLPMVEGILTEIPFDTP